MRGYSILLLLCVLAAAAPGAAHPPYGLVADRQGSVYFSDLETIWRLSGDGRLSVFRPPVPGTHVHSLALAPDGAVEGDQNRYDPSTERFYSGLWRRTGEGAEQAIAPMTERPPREWVFGGTARAIATPHNGARAQIGAWSCFGGSETGG